MTKSLLLAVLTLLAACSGNDLVLPSEGSPTAIAIVEGDEQTGRVGTVLTNPIVAQVTDALDRPVVGVAVAFTFDGGAGAALVPETATTDADGRASVQLQLGTEVGEGQGVAHVVTTDDGPTLQAGFTAVAVPASASELRAVSGSDQSGRVGSTLSAPLVVEVRDSFGNPSEGVTITWTVTGGGSVSAGTTVTGTNGRTSVQRTLGSSAGTQTTRAGASGLAGSPVVFAHTATAAAASRVTVVSGNNQNAAVATRLPQELVARVLDVSGNAVAGATVTWVVTAGGGSVEPTTSTSDGTGRASTRWTLGSAPGTNQVEARVSGADAATFTATATTGASASLAILTQPPGTATVGAVFDRQPVVQLRDASGNAVTQSGVAVTAAISSGDGTLAGSRTRNTDANGRATFDNLRITGAVGSHTLLFAASGHTSVVSEEIDVRKATTTIDFTSDTPDPSAPGQAVTVTFSVTSSGGTPTGNVTVSASGGVESCSASVAAGSCALTLTGEGRRTLTASYGGDALFQGSSDTRIHDVEATNDGPTAVNDGYTTPEGTALVVAAPGVLANDTDPDGDQLSADNASDPPNGSVTLNPDGSFTYTPDPDYSGGDSFTYRASDGSTGSTATVAITVLGVNDAPQFQLLGGDQTAAATGGPQQVAGFAEVVSRGAPNEAAQAVDFLVEVDPSGAALFTQVPAISADGTLTYVPAGTPGTALVTVRLHDNGGTENGGEDTSQPQTFTITLTGDG